jgi:outer membrane protein assembly factor BamB
MDDFEKKDAGNDLEVELTDLDAPDKAQQESVADKIRHPRILHRVHFWMSLLTIVSVAGLLLLILVSLPRVSKQAANSAVSASVTPLDILLSVFVADGVAYVGSQHGTMYELRASDGSLLWHHAAFFRAVKCLSGGVVYVRLQDGTTDALRANDGSLLWSYKTSPAPFIVPIVVDGVAYINPQDGSVEAVRASDGLLLWRYRAGHSASFLTDVVDGVVYANSQDGTVYALQASDGSLLWRFQARTDVT